MEATIFALSHEREVYMRRALALTTLLLMAAMIPISGNVITIDAEEAVRLAQQNNLELKSERIDLVGAERARRNVWNELLPEMSLSATLSRANEVTTVQGVKPSPWNAGFTVGASLPLSAAAVHAIRATILDYEAQLIDYATAEKQLSRDVNKAFYSLILSQDSIRLAEQELDTAVQRYRQAEENYRSGLVPRLEAVSARVSAENLRPALEELRVAYQEALMEFKDLLGLGPRTDIVLEGSIEARTRSFKADQLVTRYMSNRLDVQSLEKQIVILENQKRMKKVAGLSPTLSVSYSYDPNLNDPFGSDWSNSDLWSDSGQLVLALTLPLNGFIPGSKTRVGFSEADDAVAKARLALEQSRKRAVIEIESIVLELDKSTRTMKALELNVELAEEAYELTEKAYESGTKELLEVQSASDELQKALLTLLNEKYNYLSGLLDLEYALNTALSELEE
jgi:outer membrane protein TolC